MGFGGAYTRRGTDELKGFITKLGFALENQRNQLTSVEMI